MKTRCPNCETLYDIDEATLASANYTAVCCQCHQVFNAKNSIVPKELVTSFPADYVMDDPSVPGDETPGIRIEQGIPHTPEPGEDDWAFVQQRDIEEDPKPAASPTTDVPEDFTSLAAAELPADQFSKPQKPKSKPGPWVTVGVVTLALLAATQLVWINKERLLEYPKGRQVMQIVCGLVACDLEHQKAIDEFLILHRNLQPSISHPQALSFTLSFANDADFSQPLPMLPQPVKSYGLAAGATQILPGQYVSPATSKDRSIKPQEIINVELLLQYQALKVSSFKLEIL